MPFKPVFDSWKYSTSEPNLANSVFVNRTFLQNLFFIVNLYRQVLLSLIIGLGKTIGFSSKLLISTQPLYKSLSLHVIRDSVLSNHSRQLLQVFLLFLEFLILLLTFFYIFYISLYHGFLLSVSSCEIFLVRRVDDIYLGQKQRRWLVVLPRVNIF